MRWLLVLLLLWYHGVAACPEGCSCHHDKGLYTATCSHVPHNFGRVEVLNVLPSQRWDSPQELTDGQFNQARHLKYLNLRNNSLYFIHKKAFYGAIGLLEIDLSYNYIEELDPILFQHLTSLTTLKLRGNPIHLEPEVPFVISNSIQTLDIGECKLKSVPRGVFYGLKRLRYLSLDGNYLKSLKYNSLPKGLRYINLSKNLIVNVPSEVISSLTNLRKLNLGGNPINCSCSLMNLQDWLSGKGVVFEENVICALPHEYSGVSWGKVNENRLCLAEARRDEMSHSAAYSKQFKAKHQKHFVHENSYSEENIQADQPQPQTLHPDAHTEVVLQNDETKSMGEMMRDEAPQEETVSATETSDSSSDITNPMDEPTNSREENNKIEDSNIDREQLTATQASNDKAEDENIPETINKHDDDTVESVSSSSPTENVDPTVYVNKQKNENENSDLSTQPVDLNGNNTVVFKHLNENEENDDTDEFKKEGFLVNREVNNNVDTNNTLEEETTETPILEETSEVEMGSTDEPLTTDTEENSEMYVGANNSLSTLEPINSTLLENFTNVEDLETIPPPVIVPELTATKETQNNSEPIGSIGQGGNELSKDPTGIPENKSLQDINSSNNSIEERIKEVHGAEVLMFCLGVLVICLILYSIYKCRISSSRRHTTRTAKDIELNRGTEMQDMASLIPKPSEDDGMKNHLKYPDKGTSSENMKLITEQNDTESPIKKGFDNGDTKTKGEDKNSLNNNTSSSPTSKTPLLKPETAVTITPAAPIQRTRVKVGIIPDSIPRTPIFVQKTYNNGTKHV